MYVPFSLEDYPDRHSCLDLHNLHYSFVCWQQPVEPVRHEDGVRRLRLRGRFQRGAQHRRLPPLRVQLPAADSREDGPTKPAPLLPVRRRLAVR
jgi:hypothetical protein